MEGVPGLMGRLSVFTGGWGMAQVKFLPGAGDGVWWRRCDFRVETCAVIWALGLSSGAGTPCENTPAPRKWHTCARNSLYLRQGPIIPALRRSWEGRMGEWLGIPRRKTVGSRR